MNVVLIIPPSDALLISGYLFHHKEITLTTIRRPAKIWIPTPLQRNNTKYITFKCPMDYFVPYSSDINLLHPDLRCQFNKTGILFSQCQHHFSMVFG